MTLRPCLDCGHPCDGPRCDEHKPPDRKPSSRTRGYDTAWTRLSKRARRLQPWCSSCGATEHLEADHLPSAWERHAAGLPVRLADVQVLCSRCNKLAGAARGLQATRGDTPASAVWHPQSQAKFPLHTAES